MGTPTAPSSSSASVPPHISMESTPFSDRSPRDLRSSTSSKPLAPALERPSSHASSPNADSFPEHFECSHRTMVDKEKIKDDCDNFSTTELDKNCAIWNDLTCCLCNSRS